MNEELINEVGWISNLTEESSEIIIIRKATNKSREKDYLKNKTL